jgi:hypothetical protein
MKIKVYICKFDDSIVLAKKLNLRTISFGIKKGYRVTKLFKVNEKIPAYLVDYFILNESFKTNYVYIGDF